MNNREQIRAQHAIEFWDRFGKQPSSARGVNSGDVVSKLPSLIQSNGLLATAAFAHSKGGGHEELLLAVFRHLSAKDVGILPPPTPAQGDKPGLDDYIRLVSSKGSSERLRVATDEALLYLGYLKRFAPKSGAHSDE
ncbi:MAG: type III-B CRISPR module-associated protein Cmr5 [Kiritimatiellae bacterium]|nr:type III-B CRISPR module-associated protein Cmr5 [Kiritimatiellia bacterium]